MKRGGKSKLIYKSLIALTCMLSTSGAMAVSYFIVDGYENTGMCQAVKKALSEGMVLDATRPLCERRFELSSRAKSLGLSGIKKTLLPPSSYMDLWLKMAQVDGQESRLQSTADRKKNENIIYQNMKNGVNKIFVSNFDADNSGIVNKVYIEDNALCDIKDDYPDSSVMTYIEKSDGALDQRWGAHTSTAGIPFIYKDHTYYIKWQSLSGNPDKRRLAQLDVYDAVPFHPELKDILPSAGFTPPHCEIYTYKSK